jgi:poly [ADP-ribose] polymerase
MMMAKTVSIPVDPNCPLSKKGAKVHSDWDCMLNQTNIGANNNKFYVIQVLEQAGKYYAWNRWGRVGEDGQTALKGPTSEADAIKDFRKKFKDKTSNDWDDRGSFKAKSGKYTLIEIDRAADSDKAEELNEKLAAIDSAAAKIQPKLKVADSKLHPSVTSFMDLIFDHDMFKGSMAQFDIDVNKMPLGQITKSQVGKGYDVLNELEDAIEKKRGQARYQTLTSEFFTLIPHSFGRQRPPVIDNLDLVLKKKEMLNVLSDIEVALGLQKEVKADTGAKLKPHPADEHYKTLKAAIEPIDKKSKEYEFIEKYVEATADRKLGIIDVFSLDRHKEDDLYSEHDKLDNRKLLWHGTNVAVVAAILRTGLRIMPHSGGRVGKGIYLASENRKSQQYVSGPGSTRVMFLAEAVLGKEHHITRDDSSLKAAPKGFHSIVAKGHTEPDPDHDLTWTFGSRKVVVPQGKPTKQSAFGKSSFTHSEYLVYNESQVRLRYALRLKF